MLYFFEKKHHGGLRPILALPRSRLHVADWREAGRHLGVPNNPNAKAYGGVRQQQSSVGTPPSNPAHGRRRLRRRRRGPGRGPVFRRRDDGENEEATPTAGGGHVPMGFSQSRDQVSHREGGPGTGHTREEAEGTRVGEEAATVRRTGRCRRSRNGTNTSRGRIP